MKTNRKVARPRVKTHEGGKAVRTTALVELKRAVGSCLLFEDTFYEGGQDIAARIEALCAEVSPEEVAGLAICARNEWKLRHVPLLLARCLARGKGRLVGDTIAAVVQRPDEAAEFLSLYWREASDPLIPGSTDGKSRRLHRKRAPLSAQVKRGLALAFRKWDAYQLAKWDRQDRAIRLRDVLFLSHAKPATPEQGALWKHLIDGTLPPADTWEVALSGGADKKEAFTRLLSERRLGYMALLQNLRNMEGAGVDRTLVKASILGRARGSKALPFRFISAAKAAPSFAADLDEAMSLALVDATKFPGLTVLVIDVSGSMDAPLSKRGSLSRIEAAGALAVLLRHVCEDARVFTFSGTAVEISSIKGLGLVEKIANSQPHGWTYLAAALLKIATRVKGKVARTIVITDEQAHDGIAAPLGGEKGYIVNVAPYAPALDAAGGWTRVNGFSERIIDWIRLEESGYAAPLADLPKGIETDESGEVAEPR